VISRSEGEVPLSPGDARWYALVKARDASMNRKIGEASKTYFSSTVEAFLGLKHSAVPFPKEAKSSDMAAHPSIDDVKYYSVNSRNSNTV